MPLNSICKPTRGEKEVSAQRQSDGLGDRLPPRAQKNRQSRTKKELLVVAGEAIE
jgi:hypothetical protein